MASFVKDQKFISEEYKVKDLLDISDYVDKLEYKIELCPERTIFGIVGRFGTGKSVMLEQIKARKAKDSVWIHFDAWKYPDRKNLWEGFVLDFAKTIDPKEFAKVKRKIDGEDKDGIKALIRSIGTLTDIFIPNSSKAIDKLTYFAKSSPARRIIDIQEILVSLIEKTKNTIYIVAEDVDRSGNSGIFFIETLNQFLSELDQKVSNKIIVFVPISDESYSKNIEAYIKCLDYIEIFSSNKNGLQNFISNSFKKKYVDNPVFFDHLCLLLNDIYLDKKLTIRTIKLILRNAYLAYSAQVKNKLKPDPRLNILLEASKFIKVSRYSEEHVLFNLIIKENAITEDGVITNLLTSIARNELYEQGSAYVVSNNLKQSERQIKFVEQANINNSLMTVIQVNARKDPNDALFICPDFYINY